MDRVRECIQLSDNVVALVVTNIKSLSNRLQTILTTSAFLRATFRLDTLLRLLEARDFFISEEEVIQELDVALQAGLLENSLGSREYKFAHDRIQEGILELVSEDERPELCLCLGLKLVEISEASDSSEDGVLFVAMDLLNSLPQDRLQQKHDKVTFLQMARWNFKVGESATKIAAFAPASRYFGMAISFLEHLPNRWTNHYDLSISLYVMASQVEFCVGSFTSGRAYVDKVLENGRSFDDMLPAYQSLSNGLGQREKHGEACHIDKKILRSLGELPHHTHLIGAILQSNALKKELGKVSDDEILNLPIMSDPKRLAAMNTLSDMSTRSFYMGKQIVTMCCAIRQVRILLREGLCAAGTYAMAGCASFFAFHVNEDELGKRLARLALRISDRLDDKSCESRLCFVVAE